jgi:hypothetical protein
MLLELGAGLHLLLSSWRAIVTYIGSDVRDLDSIGQCRYGVRRIVEFAMLDDAPRDGLAREVGHAPDRLSSIAVILIDAFKIPPSSEPSSPRDAVHRGS